MKVQMQSIKILWRREAAGLAIFQTSTQYVFTFWCNFFIAIYKISQGRQATHSGLGRHPEKLKAMWWLSGGTPDCRFSGQGFVEQPLTSTTVKEKTLSTFSKNKTLIMNILNKKGYYFFVLFKSKVLIILHILSNIETK